MVNKELANLKNRFTEDKLSLNVAEPKYFFFIIINFFITFNQIYKTYSKRKQKKHKTICTLDTRLYLVIYFSLTYKLARYHRSKRQKQSSKRCSVKKTLPKISQNSQEETPSLEPTLQQSCRSETNTFIKK